MYHNYLKLRNGLCTLALLCILTCTGWAQWSTLPAALPDQLNWTQTTVLNGKLYTFGGISSQQYLAAAQVLDLANPTAWTPIAGMANIRFGGYAAAINGKIYIVGGTSNSDQSLALATTVLEYDPGTNSYTTKSQIPVPVTQFAGAVIGSKIYIIGGETNIITQQGQIPTRTAAVQVYDVAANTWSTSTDAPYMASYAGATAVNGVLYLAGGFQTSSVSFLDKAYKGTVTPTNIDWVQIPSLPAPLQRHAMGSVGGKVYVAAGVGPEGASEKTYVYDPVTNKWANDYPMTAAPYNGAGLPTDGTSLYYPGGYQNVSTFKFTPAAPAPVAVVGPQKIALTVKSGASVQTQITIANRGLQPLTGTVEIATADQAWLSTNLPNINVAPSGSATAQFTANSASLTVGMHKATVNVKTNDATNATIPVTIYFFVEENPIRLPFTAVIEEVGGSWCPPCYAGGELLKSIKQTQGDKVRTIAYHSNQGGSPTNTDPLHFPGGYNVAVALGLPFFPAASFSRYTFPGEVAPMVGAEKWESYLGALMSAIPYEGAKVEITKRTFNAATNTVTAEISVTLADALVMTEGLTINATALVLQDGIVYRQASPSGYVDPYTYDHVVRGVGPSTLGAPLTINQNDLVDGSIIPPGTTMTGTLTVNVDVSTNQGTPAGQKFAFDPEKSELVVLAHVNFGNAPGPILGSAEMEVTEETTPGATISIATGTSAKTIEPMTTATYETTIQNLTDAPQMVHVTRKTNNVPTGWTSSFMVGATEYTDVTTAMVSIPAGASIKVTVKVNGNTEKETGTISFEYEAGETILNQTYTTTTTELETTGVDEPTTGLAGLSLSENTPNPAATITRFNYTLPTASQPTIEVFNLSGERLSTLNQGQREAGRHTADLDVTTLGNGTYVVVLTANGRSVSRQITVVR